MTFTLIHPLAFVISSVYHFFHNRAKERERIVLPPDDEERVVSYNHQPDVIVVDPRQKQTPEEALGGEEDNERSGDVFLRP